MLEMGSDGFKWFFGIVEDTTDPLKLGRVKVRVLNEHDDNVSTDDLRWSHVMLPTTSASLHGAGDTPRLVVGTNVVGFYIDTHEKQLTMILGSFPIIPDMEDAKHSISGLAREQQILEKTLVGAEPASAYAAQYPFNRVISTPGGHIIELDDTPDNERIHVYHKSGSYVEFRPDGTVVNKSLDSFDIVSGNKQKYVGGSFDIQAESGTTVSKGKLHVTEELSTDTGASGTFTSQDGKTITVKKGIVTDIS